MKNIYHKIGQLLMFDFRYWDNDTKQTDIGMTVLNNDLKTAIKKYSLGSLILFRDNIETIPQTVKLINDIQNTSEIPLIIGVDQEGGVVNRLPFGSTTCGNMLISASKSLENSYISGKIIGCELQALGFNINFAPVIDVNTNQDNPIIGVRSFGENPADIWKYASKFIDGMSDYNISSCVKHFPGHGDTTVDTHVGLAVVNKTKSEIFSQELLPFIDAIENNVDTIMLAHLSMPSLDNSYIYSTKTNKEILIPATFSYEITTKLLKEKLGFKGLIITDALTMCAIKNNFNETDAVLQSIQAGSDIVMMPFEIRNKSDILKLEVLFDKINQEYFQNEEFAKRIDESYEKILNFKDKKILKNNSHYNINQKIAFAESKINTKIHQDIQQKIARQGVSWVNKIGNIPFNPTDKKILILDKHNYRINTVKNHLHQNYNNISIKSNTIDYINTNISVILKNNIIESDFVLLLTENLNKEDILPSIINDFINKNKKLSTTIICHRPYDTRFLKSSKNTICVYGASSFDPTQNSLSNLTVNLYAGIDSIFGENNMKHAFLIIYDYLENL